MTTRVLVVDDHYATDARRRSHLESLFAPLDVQAVFSSGQVRSDGIVTNDVDVVLRAVVAGASPDEWALVLVDMQFMSGAIGPHGVPAGEYGDDEFGLLIERALHQAHPGLPTVRFTDISEGAIGSSQMPYLSKHKVTSAEIGRCIALYGRVGVAQRRALLAIPSGTIFESREMFGLYAEAQLCAQRGGVVMILGESGAGKEYLARYMHGQSPRRQGPFMAVNVAGLPGELIESELFGAEKGAFTGANSSKEGFFSAAAGGTLFLDEIGELPLAAQSKLLRVLQEGEYFPVGSRSVRKVQCAVIAATRQPIDERVSTGEFRDDLFHRFTRILRVPALSGRPEDVEPLAKHLLAEAQREFGKVDIEFDSDVITRLRTEPLAGNIRGMANAIRRAVDFTSNRGLIRWNDLKSRDSRESEPAALAVTAAPKPSRAAVPAVNFDHLFAALRDVRVPADVNGLRGTLAQLDAAQAALHRDLAFAALHCCRHPVKGTLKVLPAMQLVTNNAALSPTNAKRKLNELLGKNQSERVDTVALEAELQQWLVRRVAEGGP